MGCRCCTPGTQGFARRIAADGALGAMVAGLGTAAVGLGGPGRAGAQAGRSSGQPSPAALTGGRLVDGDRPADLTPCAHPARQLRVIMTNGDVVHERVRSPDSASPHGAAGAPTTT
jgi:hypothetical protein